MQVEFSVQSVRECKGAALAVLVLLSLVSLPVSQEWLERNSGYTDKPVSQALAYLAETGRVVKSRSGWMLAEGVQLMLGKVEQIDDLSRNYSDSRKNSDSALNSINVSLNNQEPEKDLSSNKTKASRNISVSERDEIWRILSAAGVRRNSRTDALIELEHITPEYLRAKIAEYKARGLSGAKWAGLLIKAIEYGEPAPELVLAENGHTADCECTECRVRRFRGG